MTASQCEGRPSCFGSVVFLSSGRRGSAGLFGKKRRESMKVTERQIAERYAAMTDDDLAALDPAKLTPEAAALRAQELKRRGLADTPAQEEARARQDEAREKALKKNYARQLTAVALVAAALFVEFVLARMVELPSPVRGGIIVVLCLLALYVLRGRR